LNTSPKVCKTRIATRNRNEESELTLSFLEEIDMYHKQLFKQLKENGNTVLILNDVCIADIIQRISKNSQIFELTFDV